MQPVKLFSEPQICPKNPKPSDIKKVWEIHFRYFNALTGKWKQFNPKKGINRFKTFKERLAEANALKESVHDALKAGWNPITGEYPPTDPLEEINELSEMPFSKAIEYALSKCEVADRTRRNYKNSSERIMKASRSVTVAGSTRHYDFSSLPISQVKKKHIKLLLDHCKRDFKWSKKAYNKHMGYFKSILSRLSDDEIIDVNPALGIKYLPVMETKKFIPYTEEEKLKIRDHLFIHQYGFFVYLMMIYHTGLRTNEVLALQVRDIDMDKRLITLYPEESRDNSKTKSIRQVPLCESLFVLMREWLMHDHTDRYFVFGSPFVSGRGNAGSTKTGRGTSHPDYFKPSLTRVKRDTVTRLWKKLIMDNKELNIKKYLYAAKHTGGDDKIMAGIDLDALKEMYGHSSKYMTEKYVSKLKEIHSNQIKNLSPEFAEKKPG